MIKPDSRYVNSAVVPMEDGTVAVFRRFPTDPHLQDTRFLVWAEYMRMDRVAGTYANAPHLWWRIMDLNPSIANVWDIRPGNRVRINAPESKRNL